MVPATASVADSCCAIDSAPVEAVQPVPESGLDGESSCSPLSATASPYQCRSLGVTHCCRKLTELRQRLWPDDTFVDFDHGINTAVKKLREVLADSADNPRFVET